MPFAWPCAFRARLHYRSTGALPPDHCGSGFIPWSASSSAACPQVWWSRSQRSRRHTLRPLGALVSWWLISAFRSALRFLRATLPLYPSKNESGKEKVKFFDLYQALTKDEPWGGKEKGSDKVFCLVVKFLTRSHSRQFVKFVSDPLRCALGAWRLVLCQCGTHFSLSALPWHLARATRPFRLPLFFHRSTSSPKHRSTEALKRRRALGALVVNFRFQFSRLARAARTFCFLLSKFQNFAFPVRFGPVWSGLVRSPVRADRFLDRFWTGLVRSAPRAYGSLLTQARPGAVKRGSSRAGLAGGFMARLVSPVPMVSGTALVYIFQSEAAFAT